MKGTHMNYEIDDLQSFTGTVKELPLQEQPREKLMNFGPKSLTDAELLAILLRTGSTKMNVLDTSRHLLKKHGGLLFLFRKSWQELAKITGIGPIKALTLEAAFELGRRVQQINLSERPQFRSPASVAEFFIPLMRDSNIELFYVLCVDSQNRLITYKKIAEGTKTGCGLDIADIIKEAILANAPQIFILHNHPSGALKASQADLILTKRVQSAATVMGIKVLDHIIIAGNDFLSFSHSDLLHE